MTDISSVMSNISTYAETVNKVGETTSGILGIFKKIGQSLGLFQNTNTTSTDNNPSNETLQKMVLSNAKWQLYSIYLKEGGSGDITSEDFLYWAQNCPYKLKDGSATSNALTNNLTYFQ